MPGAAMADTSLSIVGAGVVGLAIAARLARHFPVGSRPARAREPHRHSPGLTASPAIAAAVERLPGLTPRP
jgi:glycine/D-amino acid oxidase-like deaminating enzyme